jgi:hypothetical protein
MALFYGQPCPLCGVKMKDNDRLFATSHFLGPDSDLWEFSDAVMHWDCYANWEHRARFGRMYFESERRMIAHNEFWGVAHSDEHLLVAVNPEQMVSRVKVSLAETGSGFGVALAEWKDWINGECLERCHHDIEREALLAVLPLLRSKLPTVESIIAAAGMNEDREPKIASASDMVERISYEIACQTLAERAVRKGLTCPGCGIFSTNFEYMRVEMVSEEGPQSYLVCRHCGLEFGPLDVQDMWRGI